MLCILQLESVLSTRYQSCQGYVRCSSDIEDVRRTYGPLNNLSELLIPDSEAKVKGIARPGRAVLKIEFRSRELVHLSLLVHALPFGSR